LALAEEYNMRLKNPIELASVYERQSECYMEMNSLNRALSLAKKGLQYAQIVVNKKYLIRAFKNISQIYEKKGNYKQALHYYRKSIEINEEILDSQKISQILLLAKLTVSSLKIKDPTLSEKQEEVVNNSIHLLNTAFEELRNISHNLAPFLLKEKGLVVSVSDLLNKIGKANNWVVNFEAIGFEKRLDGFIETTLFRVIQEVFSNIIRHAAATDVNCQLIKTEKDVTIMIEDNGKGFEISQIKKSDGIGIHNLYSRIENLNGAVLLDSVLGRGTIITLIVPITNTTTNERG